MWRARKSYVNKNNNKICAVSRQYKIQYQCSQIFVGRFRHLGLKNSPKSPTFRPNFAHFSPNLDQIFANFWPPRPFLLLFYVTMSEKIEISPIFSKNSLGETFSTGSGKTKKSWPKNCSSFCIIFGHFTKITKNVSKNFQNILKIFEILGENWSKMANFCKIV